MILLFPQQIFDPYQVVCHFYNIHVYIYIYVCVCVCVYTCIYVWVSQYKKDIKVLETIQRVTKLVKWLEVL